MSTFSAFRFKPSILNPDTIMIRNHPGLYNIFSSGDIKSSSQSKNSSKEIIRINANINTGLAILGFSRKNK